MTHGYRRRIAPVGTRTCPPACASPAGHARLGPARPRAHADRGSVISVGGMEAHGDSHESAVEVELHGLSIYTHHGVSDAEQETGQRLVIDVDFDVPDCD